MIYLLQKYNTKVWELK